MFSGACICILFGGYLLSYKIRILNNIIFKFNFLLTLAIFSGLFYSIVHLVQLCKGSMHFINLLGENDTEIAILTHQIKSVLVDIILPRLPILRIVVLALGTAHQFSYRNPKRGMPDYYFIISFYVIFPDDTAVEHICNF